MKVLVFHLMPWPYLPPDFADTEPSAWVTYSNANFDPERGRELYMRYLSELVYGEELGFDAICVNEHHQTPYGLMPVPNLMAMALAERTSRVQIAIVGNAMPLRDHPVRLAEEIATLDLMSGGRIICGLVRGIGPEAFSQNINPVHSEARFREGYELLVAAWNRPGPFAWEGEHYSFPYVNPWPRPLQRPHPPVWVTTTGSGSTIGWAAERRLPILMTASPEGIIARTLADYRAAARAAGYEAHPHQMGWAFHMYVGADDETALAEFTPHIEYLYQSLRRRPTGATFPPGYLSPSSWKGMLQTMAARGGMYGVERPTAAELNARGEILVGGPETVLRRLREQIDRSGAGSITPIIHTGTMTHAQTLASMERFAEHVLPELKDYLPEVPAAVAAAGSGR